MKKPIIAGLTEARRAANEAGSSTTLTLNELEFVLEALAGPSNQVKGGLAGPSVNPPKPSVPVAELTPVIPVILMKLRGSYSDDLTIFIRIAPFA
jgi:hypothetical protein